MGAKKKYILEEEIFSIWVEYDKFRSKSSFILLCEYTTTRYYLNFKRQYKDETLIMRAIEERTNYFLKSKIYKRPNLLKNHSLQGFTSYFKTSIDNACITQLKRDMKIINKEQEKNEIIFETEKNISWLSKTVTDEKNTIFWKAIKSIFATSSSKEQKVLDVHFINRDENLTNSDRAVSVGVPLSTYEKTVKRLKIIFEKDEKLANLDMRFLHRK